jgi:hypothetical protein
MRLTAALHAKRQSGCFALADAQRVLWDARVGMQALNARTCSSWDRRRRLAALYASRMKTV